MGTLGMWEIFALIILALMIFGPEKLPEMARQVGKTVAAVRREATGTLDELKRAAELDDLKGVADDLRGAGAELKAMTNLTGPIASSAGATGAAGATVQASGPAPFDPDAT